MEKRIVGIYVVMLVCATTLFIRIGSLTVGGGNLATAARAQSTHVMDVGSVRGYFYDRNMKPLVNRDSRVALAVTPTPSAAEALQEVLSQQQFEESLKLLQTGRPLVLHSDRMPVEESQGLLAFEIPVRYREIQGALHLIGYTDAGGTGVAGLEKGYNDLLSSWSGKLQVAYQVTATGGVISGETQEEVRDTLSDAKGGVVLTLDREIQDLVEENISNLDKGAVVVMEAGTGDILAMASRPTYDLEDLAAALDDPDSPFLNRGLGAYNLGSCFKICMVAAALEAGYSPEYSYECVGAYQLGEQIYHCNNRAGHGELTMAEAIEKSCNPYFINLGQELGINEVYQMAYDLGFGSPARLGEGVYSASGNLPEPAGVTAGELANLSFGQGRLTATPVQVAQMMSIVAGDGMWVSPRVVLGTTENGATLDPVVEETPQKRVMSPQTAATIREMLREAVETGSGRRAKPDNGTAGGKTSSAQTGRYEEDIEVVHGWFAGFFPAEQPEYVVVVFAEGGGEGSILPAELFRSISEAILNRDLEASEEFYR